MKNWSFQQICTLPTGERVFDRWESNILKMKILSHRDGSQNSFVLATPSFPPTQQCDIWPVNFLRSFFSHRAPITVRNLFSFCPYHFVPPRQMWGWVLVGEHAALLQGVTRTHGFPAEHGNLPLQPGPLQGSSRHRPALPCPEHTAVVIHTPGLVCRGKGKMSWGHAVKGGLTRAQCYTVFLQPNRWLVNITVILYRGIQKL